MSNPARIPHTSRIASSAFAQRTALVLIPAASALASTVFREVSPPDLRIASARGHEICYRVLGSGQPAIVMISGLGGGMGTLDDVAQELANLGSTSAEVEQTAPAVHVPALILSRAMSEKPSAVELTWSEGQRGLTRRYPDAKQSIAPASGHYLHADNPAWFVETLRDYLRNLTRRNQASSAGI